MKERLEEEMLHTIILSTSAVQWVKYKKEIRVDGKMFDIKSFTIINENYIFTGLYDEEETKLNNYLEKHSNQKNDTENNVLSSLFKMLHSLYANEAREELTQGRFTRSYSPLILQHTSSPFRNILTPPPQL